METTAINKHEAKVIVDTVELFSREGYEALKLRLMQVFGKNITCDHYIMLGQVIGLKAATDNNSRQKSNLFNYGKGHVQN